MARDGDHGSLGVSKPNPYLSRLTYRPTGAEIQASRVRLVEAAIAAGQERARLVQAAAQRGKKAVDRHGQTLIREAAGGVAWWPELATLTREERLYAQAKAGIHIVGQRRAA